MGPENKKKHPAAKNIHIKPKQITDNRALITNVLSKHRKQMRPKDIFAYLEKKSTFLSEIEKQHIRNILRYECSKPTGLYIRTKNGYELRTRIERKLKKHIRQEAAKLGFKIRLGAIKRPELKEKNTIRAFHNAAREEKYLKNLSFLERYEEQLLDHFADGSDINPHEIWPRLEVVKTDKESGRLFRYASLLWSIPVSEGYGRRVRFLIRDEHTNKIIGLFALGDPVFNLTCRDSWIGWNHHDREERLYNVMDIFVLGSVPPYNVLLGGKLVAMLAASNKVQEIIRKRYKNTKTVINNKKKDPRLVLLTTGAAFGKSALYDRISFNGELLYQRIGESKGWGHFHLNHGLFEELRTYLDATSPGKSCNRFGSGPNWKIRTMRGALSYLNIPVELLQHGVRRDIYAIPLIQNYSDFLKGETNRIERKDLSFNDLASYWKERWLQGRVQRKPEYKEFNHLTISKLVHNAGGKVGGGTNHKICERSN